jgi:hypothetical protein
MVSEAAAGVDSRIPSRTRSIEKGDDMSQVLDLQKLSLPTAPAAAASSCTSSWSGCCKVNSL